MEYTRNIKMLRSVVVYFKTPNVYFIKHQNTYDRIYLNLKLVEYTICLLFISSQYTMHVVSTYHRNVLNTHVLIIGYHIPI